MGAKFSCKMRVFLSLQEMDVNQGQKQVVELGEGWNVVGGVGVGWGRENKYRGYDFKNILAIP
jgi:hypothetical protein